MNTITEQYEQEAVIVQVQDAYENNEPKSVQLQQFLSQDARVDFYAALRDVQWSRERIADRYARSIAPLPAALSGALEHIEQYIERVTGVPVRALRLERYAHRDYTLRNDEEKPPGLYAYLDFTLDWPSEAGGETIITDENGELVRVEPLENTLVLVDCSEAYPFVRYVNMDAGEEALVRIVFAAKL